MGGRLEGATDDQLDVLPYLRASATKSRILQHSPAWRAAEGLQREVGKRATHSLSACCRLALSMLLAPAKWPRDSQRMPARPGGATLCTLLAFVLSTCREGDLPDCTFVSGEMYDPRRLK